MKSLRIGVWALGLAILAGCGPAQKSGAEDPADFYRGKTISIIVGFSPGGGYDNSARVLSKHLGKYVPGHPRVIVQNMPGAGTLVAANHIYNAAPRDGTVIGIVSDLMTIGPLLEMTGAQFDPREIGWLGSLTTRGTALVLVRSDAPAVTVDEARENVVLIGASGPDGTSTYAYLMNEMFGTKFKVVLGYVGGTEINLAIERGEVHGRTGYDWASVKRDHPEWVANKFVTPMIQLALKPSPDLPGVPLAADLVKTEAERQVLQLLFGYHFQRTFSAPSGVPAERLAALRKAFKDVTTDPEFRKEAGVFMPQGVDYHSPEEITDFIARSYAMPPEVIGRAAKFVGQAG